MTNTGQNPYAPVDEEIIGRWMASLDLASGTKETYLSGFRAFCWFVRSTSLDFDELTRDDVKSFKEYLVNEKKLKPATVSSYLASVRSFYAYSEDNGIENIAHCVKGVTDSRSFKKEPLTPDQAQRLLASIDRSTEKGMRDFAILNLMLRTGLRDIEIVRANCKDIQTKAGVDVLYVQGKGRASKDSFVVLTPKALSPITTYLEKRGNVNELDPLFASVSSRNAGERLTVRSISRIAKSALRAIGIDDERYTAHSLRHTAITFSLLGGATERDAQQMARHANITTTMLYSHDIDRIKHAAEREIDNVLDQPDSLVGFSCQQIS